MHSIVKAAGFAVALASFAHMAQPVAASTDAGVITRQVRVEYKRSELIDQAGARQLFKRLQKAANRACGDNPMDRRGRGFHDCRDAALADAVKEIGSARLTAMWSPPQPVRLARR